MPKRVGEGEEEKRRRRRGGEEEERRRRRGGEEGEEKERRRRGEGEEKKEKKEKRKKKKNPVRNKSRKKSRPSSLFHTHPTEYVAERMILLVQAESDHIVCRGIMNLIVRQIHSGWKSGEKMRGRLTMWDSTGRG
jgi:hypothetical protein